MSDMMMCFYLKHVSTKLLSSALIFVVGEGEKTGYGKEPCEPLLTSSYASLTFRCNDQ